MTAAFQDVAKANYIAGNVGIRVFNRVPNARLRRQMNHLARLKLCEYLAECRLVRKVFAHLNEIR